MSQACSKQITCRRNALHLQHHQCKNNRRHLLIGNDLLSIVLPRRTEPIVKLSIKLLLTGKLTTITLTMLRWELSCQKDNRLNGAYQRLLIHQPEATMLVRMNQDSANMETIQELSFFPALPKLTWKKRRTSLAQPNWPAIFQDIPASFLNATPVIKPLSTDCAIDQGLHSWKTISSRISILFLSNNHNSMRRLPGYAGHLPASTKNDRGDLRPRCLTTVGEKFC